MADDPKEKRTKRKIRTTQVPPVKKAARGAPSEEVSPERRVEIARKIAAREYRGRPPSI
jgi:hypothetical protein